MVFPDLRTTDFEVFVAIGILAPISVTDLAASLHEPVAGVEEAVKRLTGAGFVSTHGELIAITGKGHENLSRRRFRQVRDVGRLLYLHRRQQGTH